MDQTSKDSSHPSILLVEDKLDVQLIVEAALRQRYRLSVAGTLAQARLQMAQERFDLILLDVGLPDGNGFDFCAELQTSSKTASTPVFFLTAKEEISDKEHGFERGAEDYITKPFEPRELVARIESRMRRKVATQKSGVLRETGNLKLHLATQRASIEESSIDLSPIEFKLLHHFLSFEDRTLSRVDLMTAVWGKEIHIIERTVDTHVSHLRKKIANSTHTIQTVQGSGYSFRKKAA